MLPKNCSYSNELKILKIHLFNDIAITLKKQEREVEGYDLLLKFIEEMKLTILIYKQPSICLFGIEQIFISLSEFCFLLCKYKEAFNHASYSLKFLENLIYGRKFLIEIKNLFNLNVKKVDFYISKKKQSIAYCNFIIAKSLLNVEKINEGFTHLEKAKSLAEKLLGKNNPITIKYENKFREVKSKIEFETELKNDSFNDFSQYLEKEKKNENKRNFLFLLLF